MEIWIAAIAVLGTLAGASISPIVAALGQAASLRSKSEAQRTKAATRFGVALLEHATHPESGYVGPTFRKYRDQALRSRIELGGFLRSGDGRVDDFTMYAVGHLVAYSDVSERTEIANHASRRVLEWARGERGAKALVPFRIVRMADGDRIRESKWAGD